MKRPRPQQTWQPEQKALTALITGASGGLGAEFARLFAADGWNLLLVARREEKLIALKAELEAAYGVQVAVLAEDLAADGAAQNVAAFANAQHISVGALVNNAGFGDWGLFAFADLDKQERMIAVNIAALTTLTRLFLSAMLAHGSGRILNVASIAAFMPGAKMSVYYATKAFVRSFSEALAVELAGSGVTVTALCPGPVASEFWDVCGARSSGIFRHLLFADAKSVARYGYRALQKGTVLALPGVSVRLFALLSRLLPRAWVRKIVYIIQK